VGLVLLEILAPDHLNLVLVVNFLFLPWLVVLDQLVVEIFVFGPLAIRHHLRSKKAKHFVLKMNFQVSKKTN